MWKMASHSKMQQVLGSVLLDCECTNIFHPYTKHCCVAVVDMLWAAFRGSLKFYSFIYVLQLLLKGRKADREYLKNHVINLLRSAVFGSAMSATFIASGCLLRAVLGRYTRYTAAAVPAAIAGITIFMERSVKRSVYAYTFFQAVLEYSVRLLEASGIGPLSRRNETLVFMCSNAILLYLLKKTDAKEVSYWFYKPPSVIDANLKDIHSPQFQGKQIVCPHKETCNNYIMKSIVQYAGAGVGIQLLRATISKMRPLLEAPYKTLKVILWNPNTFKLGAFLGAYIGIYKSVSCLLCRYYDGDSDFYALLAGLLAGSAYYLNPERAIGFSALTTTLQLSMRYGMSIGVIPRLPYTAEMIFALSCGLMFHTRFVDAENCPRFVVRTLSTVTKGRADYFYRMFVKIFDEYTQRINLVG